MTAEGTFPKSDGNILYASEANTFYKIRTLGNGSGTSNDARESLGSFSITEDLGSGKIIFQITLERASGVGVNMEFSLGNTSSSYNSGNYQTTGQDSSNIKFEIMKSGSATTQTSGTKTLNGTTSNMLGQTEFNTSAAETFFLNIDTHSGGTWSYNWIAYIIAI